MEEEKPKEQKEKVLNADFSNMKNYKLLRPTKIADKTYTVLNFDFDSLNGNDMDSIIAVMTAQSGGIDMNINAFNPIYQKHIAARAAKIRIEELNNFHLSDISAICLIAQGFLLKAASRLTES
jgi:hypothetical protein